MQNRKNLAVIGVGIISTGLQDQGIPAMVNALKKMQDKYSITIYSFIPVDKTRAPKNMRVRCIWNRNRYLKIQYLLLVMVFIKDHLFNRYEIIHAQSPYPAGVTALWLNKFFKIPWLLSLHAGEAVSLPEVLYGDLLHPRLRKAAFDACPKADVLVTMSHFQAEMTRQNLKLEREIHVLPRGVECGDYCEKSLNGTIRFIHVSNYDLIKDYETLLKTFAIVSAKIPAALTIVGDEYAGKLDNLIRQLNLGDKIRFTGPVQNHLLSDYFNNAHVLLHTSRYEALPMVILEAMANSVAACGTHVGLLADFSDKFCLTVAPGEFEPLANKILKLLSNEAQYNQLRRNAYDWIGTRNLQWYVNELEKLYLKTTE